MRIAIAAAGFFAGTINAAENGGNIETGKLKASLCERYQLKWGQGFGPNPALAGQTLEYEDIADLAAYYPSLK
jgi:hypothetical protein